MTPSDPTGRLAGPQAPGRGGHSAGAFRPGRREILAAAALAAPLLTAGCAKGVGALGTPPRPLPDVATLRAAIARERLMIARYQSTLAAEPPLSAVLAPLLAEHRAHLSALRSRLVDPHGGSPHVPARAPGVPAGPGAAIAALRDAEVSAAAALLADLDTASPSLAQLLASVAASESTHAALLAARRRHG